MAAVGVVAEYNPLHTGHLRHLALTRQAAPGAVVVVCLSGNWVQRGDCAVTDKWRRAAWACRGGADLVVELPTPFALSSAETFARAAVSLLDAAGVDRLSFGCETPDLPALTALAAALDSPGFAAALRPHLDRGLSYPAARERALAALAGEAAGLVRRPNNNLAVEYLRALPPHIAPLPIPRSGRHDGPLEPGCPSASALRRLLRGGEAEAAGPYLAQPWEGPVYDLARLERAVLCALRQMDVPALAALPGGSDGLAQRLWRAARTAPDLPTLLDRAGTRRLTLARIRRLCLWALLGLSPADRPAAPTYLRVLAMTGAGAAHLAALKGHCPLPILTKSARHRDALALEARLTDLFSLCAPDPLPCGEEWRHSPAVLP